MPGSELELPLGMGAGAVLTRALSVVVRDVKMPLAVLLGSVALLVPIAGPVILWLCLGLGFQFADRVLGYSPPSTSFLRRSVQTILATVLASVVVAIGLVLFIAPGIYLGIKFSLVVPAIWLGDAGVIGAFGESWELTTGKAQTTLGIGLAILGVTALVGLVVFYAIVPALPSLQAGNTVFGGSQPQLRIAIVLVSSVVGTSVTATLSVMYRGFPFP